MMEMSVLKITALACAMIGILHAGSAAADTLVLQVNIDSLNGQSIAPITFDQTWNLIGPWRGSAVTPLPGLEEASGTETLTSGPSPVTGVLLAGSSLIYPYGGHAIYYSADAFGTAETRSTLSVSTGQLYADGNAHFLYSMNITSDYIPTYSSNYSFSNFLNIIETKPLNFNERLANCEDVYLSGCGSDTTTYAGYAQFVSYSGVVPEPKTWLIMALGLGAVGAIMRKHKLEKSFASA